MDMKKKGLFILKCAALLVVDATTLLLFFSVWNMAALTVFPFALLNLMAVLAILNLTVLFIHHVRRYFHTVSSTGLIAAAILYDAFTLVFTGLTYTWIGSKWFLIIALIAFAAYVISVVTLFLAGRREADAAAYSIEERVSAQEMQMLLIELETEVHNVQRRLIPRRYESLCRAFSDLKAKVSFSTPFGRANKPVVLDMEKRIADRTRYVIGRLKEQNPSDPEEWIGNILTSLMDITELIKNKEKLLFG